MAPAVMTIRAVVKAVEPLLAELGFRKRAGEVFTMEIADEDVLGWLGLNRATQHRPPGEVEINPVVGVRHQGVERLVAELRGEKFHPYLPPTVNTSLGYLLPERCYRSWVFLAHSVDDVAAGMVAAIAAHGVPFMRSAVKLPELCRRLAEGMGFEHQLVYRRPVAWLLADDGTRARKALEEALVNLRGRTDPAAQELRRFGETLLPRLAEHLI